MSELSSKEIICSNRDAVVNIVGITSEKKIHASGFFVANNIIIAPSVVAFTDFDKQHDLILAAVSNVNGGGKSYSYQLKLVAYEAIAGIAFLIIDEEANWNMNNPVILNSHPHLIWGGSRNVAAGEKITIIGNIFSLDRDLMEAASTSTYLIDNRYIDYKGKIPGELLLIDMPPHKNYGGMPVLDAGGKLIGISIKRCNLAYSEFFLRRFVLNILYSIKEGKNNFGHFSAHIYSGKSTLGLYCTLMRQEDLVSYTNKEIVGYRVREIYNFSPLKNLIAVDDIITHLSHQKISKDKELSLGDRKYQIAPALLLWRLPPDSPVKVTIWSKRKQESISFEVMTSSIPDNILFGFTKVHLTI